jgi:hypothetical protein
VNPGRRAALQGLGVTLVAPLAACSGPTAMTDAATPMTVADTVDAAFTYAFPLYEMARTRWNALESPANPQRARANVPVHRRNLSDHRARVVTTPNNDTLYTSCWVDLSAGPVALSVAPMPAGRYWSVALMDFFSNHFALPGSRLDGTGPVHATVVGPRWTGPVPAGGLIRSPGDDVWLLGRWLVDGPQDLPAARAMQDGLRLDGPSPAVPRVAPHDSRDPQNFLAVVNEALARNPGPADDAPLLKRYASVGLQGGMADAWSRLPQAVREAWHARIGPAHEALKGGMGRGGRVVDGWQLAHPALGDFGREHALRAAVALAGLAALPPVEAVYPMRAVDDAGAPLHGSRRYRLRIPAGGLPCEAFWSLTVYQEEADGRLFFADNPIGRYAIGDRTPGIVRAADGSMDIWLQREAPVDAAQRANWLPAPAGPMQLTLRAYLPQPTMVDGRAALPSVQRAA